MERSAAQRILNSRRYHHEGAYLPMRIIDHGALTGYISMNRTWGSFDFEDYYRAGQIAMGMLDEELEADLETEYLPEGGRRIGGLVDDHSSLAFFYGNMPMAPSPRATESNRINWIMTS